VGKVRAVSREGSTGGPTSAEELLAQARARIDRLTPLEAYNAVTKGATLVDIRTEGQRAEHGIVAEARYIPRNVLEWRLDPSSEWSEPEIAVPGHRVILLCHEGYQSSLAAATVREFGVDATDVIDGFTAWRRAGLPVVTAVVDAVPPALDHFASTATRSARER
jgi:rhodanese-related sulfurtransferase